MPSARRSPEATIWSGTSLRGLVSLVLGVLLLPLTALPSAASPAETQPTVRLRTEPLAGRIIVLDPGHQLGNHNFPEEINRLVPAGGFRKPCNTTGTSTNGGYPEATFTFRVTMRMKRRLERLGARVVVTRTTNRQDRWGPCVDARGRRGNKIEADLKVSIHGDGSTSGGHGFHVIAPTDRAPWTADIFKPSRRLARTLKAQLVARGYSPANYIAGGDGLDFRSDLATLNLSDVPTVMVESGNMRGSDAAWMTSISGRRAYVRALVAGITAYLAETP